jgi:hypothetical protein
MALPTSGTITMAQINAEFGRGNNLNSYRGTQWYTAAGGSGTFSTGAISMSDFYGKQLASPSFSFTISSHQDRANLRTLALNAGWNGSSAVVATLASGIWIYSSTTAAAALTIDGWFPNGVTFINNQYVAGMGGNGGAGGVGAGVAGAGGGTALAVSTYVTIYNYGYIAGGGGGGGGGGGYSVSQYVTNGGGGGGGGGTGLGTSIGGAGGIGLSGAIGSPGGNNYANSGGAGGGAGSTSAAAGGNGGGWGAAGATGGSSTSAGGAGGAAGYCTSGNGYITWAYAGNRYGPLG